MTEERKRNPTLFFRLRITFVIFILVVGVFGIGYGLFAAPPGSQYTPGETLDPSCSPGDANCSVDIYQWDVSGSNISYSSGNVGIGTTSPYARLSVVGEIVASHFTGTTTATSTFGGPLTISYANATSSFANGINLTTGCFSVGGTCVGGSSGGAWTSAGGFTTLNTPSDNVGIGTSTPYTELGVVGNVQITDRLAVGASSTVDTSGDTHSLIDISKTLTTTDEFYLSGLNSVLTLAAPVNPSWEATGVNSSLVVPNGNTTSYGGLNNAFFASVDNQGQGDLYASLFRGYIQNSSSGDFNQAYGLNLDDFGNNLFASGANIVDLRGVYVDIVNWTGNTIDNAYNFFAGRPDSTGTITNLYGLYVEDMSGRATGNDWNIYSAGANSQNIFDGFIGIATSTPQYRLHVQLSSDGNVAGFTDSNGTCTINPTSTSLACTSDERLKKDIRPITPSVSLDTILDLEGVSFKWSRQEDGTIRYGFVAQDVEAVIPELVETGPNGYKSVNYTGFAPFLVGAIQELDSRLGALSQQQVLAQVSGTARAGVLYLEELVVKILRTETLCVGETCINEEELQQLLNKEQDSEQQEEDSSTGGENDVSQEGEEEENVTESDEDILDEDAPQENATSTQAETETEVEATEEESGVDTETQESLQETTPEVDDTEQQDNVEIQPDTGEEEPSNETEQ